MFNARLNQLISAKNSLLCIGLDPDPAKLPECLRKESSPVLKFNREIIAATHREAAAFKLNIAFFEALGGEGWRILEKTLEFLPPDVIIIADAKRGDIGNSSRKYAQTFLQTYDFDAATVSPYMGSDSVAPFLENPAKGAFVLCLTSNAGSGDFQLLETEGEPLYCKVARAAARWNKGRGNCGLVVGATHPELIGRVRSLAPDLPLLIPGVGAQGGNLEAAVLAGTNNSGTGALINSSRGIIYAGNGPDFAEKALQSAQELRRKIGKVLSSRKNLGKR